MAVWPSLVVITVKQFLKDGKYKQGFNAAMAATNFLFAG